MDAADGGRSGRRGARVHPIGEPGYIARHVLPSIAGNARKAGRAPSDLAVIVPVTIVGDSDEERDRQREGVRASMALRQHAQLRVHLGPGRVRGHDRANP